MRDRPRPPTGFTLIELMIVVAIIGILAAVAIPAFIKVHLAHQDRRGPRIGRQNRHPYYRVTKYGMTSTGAQLIKAGESE